MLNVQLPPNLTKAAPKDWKALADLTATAFARDPVNQWIFGNERAIASCFRVLAREVYTKHGICHFAHGEDGQIKGATMWAHSSAIAPLSKLAEIALALGVSRYGKKGALARAIKAGEIMAAEHPKAPHVYLFTIGTLPSARGAGLGRALLVPVLDACDSAGLPCYLENSNPTNFGFYSAHGFDHMKHFNTGDGGPPLQAMWRDAR